MKNISMKQEGKEVVIRVDLSKDFGASKSGKTKIIQREMCLTTVVMK